MKSARTARGMNQTALAAKAGLSTSDISKFENLMARPYPKQAARLARALGLGAKELQDPDPTP